MYPFNNHFRGSHPDPRFGRTFVLGGDSHRPTHVQNHQQDAPCEPSGSDTPPERGGRTTVVGPGDPHYYGTRIERGRLVSPLCRCQTPDTHGDAWALTGNGLRTRDTHGRPILWKDHATKALDYYGRFPISRQEELTAYRYVLHPQSYREVRDHYIDLDRHVFHGGQLIISRRPENVQFHNGDGHVQNHVTAGGIRTRIDRPGDGGGGRSNRDHYGSTLRDYGGHR